MKIRAFLLVLAALLAAGTAAAKATARIPAPEGVLPVVVTEALEAMGNAYTDFDRLDVALQKVAQERNWPLKVVSERIASNSPDYLTELQITLQRVRQETPGEYLYRGWTTLWIDGKKHDLGIVTFRYNFRVGEMVDDRMEKVFAGAARATAAKVEPLLFPELKPEKK